METVKGSCLCGSVKFECENLFHQFHFCHCHQCQKISGSAHVSNLFTKPENIVWLEGAENIKRFDVPGRTLSNSFCGICGSSVPYISSSGKSLIVPAGGLDTDPDIGPQDNIFWSERACWYDQGISSTKFARFPE